MVPCAHWVWVVVPSALLAVAIPSWIFVVGSNPVDFYCRANTQVTGDNIKWCNHCACYTSRDVRTKHCYDCRKCVPGTPAHRGSPTPSLRARARARAPRAGCGWWLKRRRDRRRAPRCLRLRPSLHVLADMHRQAQLPGVLHASLDCVAVGADHDDLRCAQRAADRHRRCGLAFQPVQRRRLQVSPRARRAAVRGRAWVPPDDATRPISPGADRSRCALALAPRQDMVPGAALVARTGLVRWVCGRDVAPLLPRDDLLEEADDVRVAGGGHSEKEAAREERVQVSLGASKAVRGRYLRQGACPEKYVHAHRRHEDGRHQRSAAAGGYGPQGRCHRDEPQRWPELRGSCRAVHLRTCRRAGSRSSMLFVRRS